MVGIYLGLVVLGGWWSVGAVYMPGPWYGVGGLVFFGAVLSSAGRLFLFSACFVCVLVRLSSPTFASHRFRVGG